VTRMKTNTKYTTVEVCAVAEKGNVLSDQIVSLPTLDKEGEEPVPLRRVTYFNPDTGKRLKFLTNNFTLPAQTIAQIYKQRLVEGAFVRACSRSSE